MSSPKERAFIKKYINTFNPINPAEKLMEHIDTIILPKSGYLNTSTRGKKLIDLELDQVEYLFNRCKQCTADIKLISKVLYYIMWYKEVVDTGDSEDRQNYEEEFREDFKGYDIDFDAIFTQPQEDIEDNTEILTNTTDDNDVVITTTNSLNAFIATGKLPHKEKCDSGFCKEKPSFAKTQINSENICKDCFNITNSQ